jgi:hypothetical protein
MLVLYKDKTPQLFQLNSNEAELVLKVLRFQTYESLTQMGLSIPEVDKLNTMIVEMQN